MEDVTCTPNKPLHMSAEARDRLVMAVAALLESQLQEWATEVKIPWSEWRSTADEVVSLVLLETLASGVENVACMHWPRSR